MFTIILDIIIYLYNKKELGKDCRSFIEQFESSLWLFVWEIGMVLLFILK